MTNFSVDGGVVVVKFKVFCVLVAAAQGSNLVIWPSVLPRWKDRNEQSTNELNPTRVALPFFRHKNLNRATANRRLAVRLHLNVGVALLGLVMVSFWLNSWFNSC